MSERCHRHAPSSVGRQGQWPVVGTRCDGMALEARSRGSSRPPQQSFTDALRCCIFPGADVDDDDLNGTSTFACFRGGPGGAHAGANGADDPFDLCHHEMPERRPQTVDEFMVAVHLEV